MRVLAAVALLVPAEPALRGCTAPCSAEARRLMVEPPGKLGGRDRMGSSLEEESGDSEKPDWMVRIKQGFFACPVFIAICCIFRIMCWRGIYKVGVKHGKEAPLELPKGIVLSPDDLALQFAGSQPAKGVSSSQKDKLVGKELSGEWSGFHELEVCIAEEQKGSVYVFDSNGDNAETFVVLEVRGCTSGPPLLPVRTEEGALDWIPPSDRFLHLSAYLSIAMKRLTGEDWSQKIMSHMNGNFLVRYQAVVREENWRELWDVLMKPFGEQRSEYRRQHETHKAPDLFFGVQAKLCEPVPRTEAPAKAEADLAQQVPPAPAKPSPPEARGKGEQDVSTAASELASDGAPREDPASDGLCLLGAADWLEYWQDAEIPTQRTFVEFTAEFAAQIDGLSQRSSSAPHLLSLPKRSSSFPDLSDLSSPPK